MAIILSKEDLLKAGMGAASPELAQASAGINLGQAIMSFLNSPVGQMIAAKLLSRFMPQEQTIPRHEANAPSFQQPQKLDIAAQLKQVEKWLEVLPDEMTVGQLKQTIKEQKEKFGEILGKK